MSHAHADSLPIRFSASVIHGAGRGRVIGVPTLNVELSDVPPTLKHGIYACFVDVPDMGLERIRAAVHYGPRPVFQDDVSFEAHLLETTLDAPPPAITVHVIAYLREVRDFASLEELQKQIAEDVRKSKELLIL